MDKHVDVEILEIEAHAWRVWLENGDAVICRRCGNPFIPSGKRRGREDGETGLESKVPVAGGEDDGQAVQDDRAVDLCGSCLPLRLLGYGDKRARRPECVVCGGRISGRRGGTLYCKEACRKAAYRGRVRDKREDARTARDSDETEDSRDDIGSDAKGGHPTQEEASTTARNEGIEDE